LVFVDESASNEKTGERRYGWSLIGVRARAKRWLKRSKRWSVLPVYTIDGYLKPITFQGSITAEIFEDWLEFIILPECNNEPGIRDIIIMDNCSIHHNPRVEAMCAKKGVSVEYLPLYCPMFNPIEESFRDLKSAIRRHYKTEAPDYDNFEEFLREMIKRVGRGADAKERARGHFKNCWYNVDELD
jgi:transposase